MDAVKGFQNLSCVSAASWTDNRSLKIQVRRDLVQSSVITLELGTNIIHSGAGLFGDSVFNYYDVDWTAPDDSLVSVYVRLVPYILAKIAALPASEHMFVVRSSLNSFPLAAFTLSDIPDNFVTPKYLENLRSHVGRNHWWTEACFVKDGNMHVLGWSIPPMSTSKALPEVKIDGNIAVIVPAVSQWATTTYWFESSQTQIGFYAIAPYDPINGFSKIEVSYGDDDKAENIVRFPVYQLVSGFASLALPLPEPTNMHRVSGPGANHASFVNGGKSDFERFRILIMDRLKKDSLVGLHVLDWGVGCGRLGRYFIEEGSILTGIDIDNDNLDWCRANLKPASFVHVPLNPPTSLPSDSYDVIISSSVLSHLTEEVMEAWLKEMGRVLKPDGVALLSFNGDGNSYLYASWAPAAIANLDSKGFFDEWRTEDLDGFIEDGEYYRLTLMSTSKASAIFKRSMVLEDIVQGVTSGHQDIAVLRKGKA